MDCKIARMLLDAGVHRSELDPTECESLEDHLADCPLCRAFAESEHRAEEHIGRALRNVPLPEGLRGRLMERLGIERRRRQQRHALMAAAVITLATSVTTGAWWYFAHRDRHLAPVNLETAWNDVYQQTGSAPERVEEWFQETYHLQTLAPVGFNYNALKFYDLADFGGKRVPLLLFVREGANARVYILSATDFDFSNVIEAPGYNINLLRSPTDGRFAYVAVYSGERLDLFLDKNADTRVGMNSTSEARPGAE